MSLFYCLGNQTKAAEIARHIVKPLAVTDIESIVSDGMDSGDGDRRRDLYTAVDNEYPSTEKRLSVIRDAVKLLPPSIRDLFDEYSDLHIRVELAMQIAHFNLGYQAALRLLTTPPGLRLLQGGMPQREREVS